MMRSHKNAICRFVKDTAKTFTTDFCRRKSVFTKKFGKIDPSQYTGKACNNKE